MVAQRLTDSFIRLLAQWIPHEQQRRKFEQQQRKFEQQSRMLLRRLRLRAP